MIRVFKRYPIRGGPPPKPCGIFNFINMGKSCNLKHGLTRHPLYKIWAEMKSRCNNSSWRNEYHNGRNIRVCDEWNEFLPFYKWAIINGYKKGLTIDRIDNDENYCPNNCRWATYSIQNYNRRNPVRLPRNYQDYIK